MGIKTIHGVEPIKMMLEFNQNIQNFKREIYVQVGESSSATTLMVRQSVQFGIESLNTIF